MHRYNRGLKAYRIYSIEMPRALHVILPPDSLQRQSCNAHFRTILTWGMNIALWIPHDSDMRRKLSIP